MGIGEPFDNYENLLDFINVVNDQQGLSIGARHITVSTSGLVHKIYDFADTGLQVYLAISLHAPNNELRTKIMKINRAFSIVQLMEAVDYYIEHMYLCITTEYMNLKGVNDEEKESIQLANLHQPRRRLSYVNLIPYNQVDEHIQYDRSESNVIQSFYETLQQI